MKVCFLGLGISDALNGNILGGAEKQQKLMIEGFYSMGIEVLVLQYYLTRATRCQGIEVLPAWGPEDNSFLNRLKRMAGQIKSLKVDAIYARGTHIYVAFLFLYLKLTGSNVKLLWGIAGNHDLIAKYNYTRVKQATSIYGKLNAGYIFNLSSNLLYLFSDTIICQTIEQITLCKKKWIKKHIELISNIYVPNRDNKFISNTITRANAIWVNKFDGTKGEEILLQIAKAIPKIKIICLGHVTKSMERSQLYIDIKKQDNLILVGRIPNNEVAQFISQVDFVLNTSPSEGLSNVFLEGWDLEKPVVSYVVNPNNYLTEGEAGFCAEGSFVKLIYELQKIIYNKEWIKICGKNGRELLYKYHSIDKILPKYLNLILPDNLDAAKFK